MTTPSTDATTPTPTAESFTRTIREALHGSRRDYTEGPIGRAILLLAIPMVLEVILESVFAVADIFWVSHLGEAAIATVGLTESMMALVYTLAVGLSIGATATVARRIGERDPDGAARAAVQTIAMGLVIALVLAVAGAIGAPTLLRLLGGSPDVVATGASFTRVMLGGNASVVILFLINAIFRGAGDAAIAMRVLWLANIINIVLGPLLIFGVGPFPRLGVTGAAVATTIGRGAGAAFAAWRLFQPGRHIQVRHEHLRIDPALMARLLRLSGSGTLQVFIGTASWIGLIRILSQFGSAALAGYTIAIRIILFALFPSWGLGNAAATMVGQSLGARKPERAERAVWMASFYNLCFLGSVGILFVAAADAIVALFTQDPAVVPFATDGLRIVALGFPLYAYGMVVNQSFNGAGDTWTPTYLNLFVFWLFELPAAYFISVRLGAGPKGVFWAITLAFSVLAIASAMIFKRGRWKAKRV
ncbi:MAG TPA: MATE family efflux transporter [Gemmatimonadaceae bacterium]|nr:MATE family efflux transporter [Gemmatimonadaceae bacterium]